MARSLKACKMSGRARAGKSSAGRMLGRTLLVGGILCSSNPELRGDFANVRGQAVDVHDLDLSKFGVACDGSDSSAAINSALDTLRRAAPTVYSGVARISFPKGDCTVRNSINFTNLKSKSIVVDGSGTRILGLTKGRPVIDALGSEYLRFRDLTVVGGVSDEPNIGIQIGRTGPTAEDSSDNINLDSVALTGSFSFAAIYNHNAETTIFTHLVAVNEDKGKSYTVVLDGINHFDAKSEFTTVRQPVDRPQSFNENVFINCDIRHNGSGVPLWIAHASRHAFVRSYIAAIEGRFAVELYSARSDDVSAQLDFDVHFETKTLKNIFYLSGPNKEPRYRGFGYTDQYTGAGNAVFAGDKMRLVRLDNLTLNLVDAPKNTIVFASPELWMASGSVYVGRANVWNLSSNNFSGLLNIEGEVRFFGKIVTKEH